MQRLGKEQAQQKEALAAKLEAAATQVQAAIESYNAVLDEVRTFQEEVTNEAQGYFDDRSEKWQEGEKGEAYQAWVDEWYAADAEDIEVPEFGHADALRELPDQPE